MMLSHHESKRGALDSISHTKTQERLFIDGPAGPLEAVLTPPAAGHRNRAIAIVCHPHPLHGGTLNNKVTHTLAQAMNLMGAPALRFNFRGVGASAGSYAHGEGETEDLLAAIAWARHEYPGHELWLAGFSFGAYVALHAAQLTAVDQLITVGPPIHLFSFESLSPPDCPWLLIQAKDDEVVSFKEVLRWASRIYPAPQAVYLDHAGHYFHGQLSTLRDAVTAHLNTHTGFGRLAHLA